MPRGSHPSSVVRAIAELPFRERPVLELLNLVGDRPDPDPDYAGYGWARVSRVWLAEPGAPARPVDDVLLLALHCPDDGEALADDIELYFELPEEPPVTVLASKFFASWLPRLPRRTCPRSCSRYATRIRPCWPNPRGHACRCISRSVTFRAGSPVTTGGSSCAPRAGAGPRKTSADQR